MKQRSATRGFILVLILTAFVTTGCEKWSKSWNEYWWAKQAQEAHSNGEDKKAEELYLKLVELNPDNPDNLWDLAILYLDLNQEKKALEIRDKFEKIGQKEYAQKLEEVIRSSQHTIHRSVAEDKRR